MNGVRSRLSAVVAVAALAGAACSGDDGGSAGDTESDTGDTGTVGAASDTVDDATDDQVTPAPPSGPSTVLAESLHGLDLPEPGTARVTLAGETYVFESLGVCQIDETDRQRSFRLTASGVHTDGSELYVEMSRVVVDVEALDSGVDHERDYLQIAVQQEIGVPGFSNAWHDATRAAPGEPVRGDGDELPVIRVVDDGGVVAATGLAEVTNPPFTRDFDRTGEGVAEFAVVC